MGQRKKLRFAVLGVGHFAQTAVIPGFSAVGNDAELVAVISDDPKKRQHFGTRHGRHTWRESELDAAFKSGTFDAVYIATPNHLHLEQATSALRAGIHVLLEKPMTVTLGEARRLQRVAQQSQAQLMVAYRLHCDPLYVETIRAVRTGAIGEPRIFTASFTMQVASGNVRTKASLGGGSVPDLGVYCINAARTVFGGEPLEVRALAVGGRDRRSRSVDEMTSAILRFPGDALANFTCSFGAASTAWFQVIGTTGSLCLDAAFEAEGNMELTIERNGRKTRRVASIGDQVAGEIAYFVDCIRRHRAPEIGVDEGFRDLRVIEAITAAGSGRGKRLLKPMRAKAGPQSKTTVRRRRAKADHTKAKRLIIHAAPAHARE